MANIIVTGKATDLQTFHLSVDVTGASQAEMAQLLGQLTARGLSYPTVIKICKFMASCQRQSKKSNTSDEHPAEHPDEHSSDISPDNAKTLITQLQRTAGTAG